MSSFKTEGPNAGVSEVEGQGEDPGKWISSVTFERVDLGIFRRKKLCYEG